jgi:hypothetical protein
MVTVPADEIGADQDVVYAATDQTTAEYRFAFNGQRIKITYSLGPQHGIWAVYLDGQPYLDPDSGEAFTIDGYNSTLRYEVTQTFQTQVPGEHTLNLVNTEGRNPDSQGNVMSVGQVEVLPPARQSNLLFVIGLIVITELVGLALALLLGKPLFSGLAAKLDTQRSILLALVIYTVIAIWGFFLDSVIEFWFLAWMVAVVQGGSQALSRSLYAAMSPSYKSGEFFGLFGIMEKFSAIIGPLTFAAAGVIFGSSRPAVLSLVLFFIVGGYILMRVNVPEGKRVARQDDAQYLAKQAEA